MDACLALLASHSSLPSTARLCVCAGCLRSLCFSVSHHGDWLLLVGERACGCHCRSVCRECGISGVPPCSASSLLGCDVTTTDLPLRHALNYEEVWPAGERCVPPSLAAAMAQSQQLAVSSAYSQSAAAPFARCAAVLSDYLAMFASQLRDDERCMLASHTLPAPADVRPLSDKRAAIVCPPSHCLTAFAVVWSVKEAVVKAVGLGLAIQLRSLHVRLTQPQHTQQPTLYRATVDVRCVRPEEDAGCVAAGQSRCGVGSWDCCRALDWQWQVDIVPVDERHTAAVAHATHTLRDAQHDSEHAAQCRLELQLALTRLASQSVHPLSPLLRLVELNNLLLAVGIATSHTS